MNLFERLFYKIESLFYTPTLESAARNYAKRCHRNTNHKYDKKPYEYHLSMVVRYAKLFSHLLNKGEIEIAIAGCWVHDIIEDARETYNDVMKLLGFEVAEIAYALTNEKGRSRKERANRKYYEGIRQNKIANFVKICDRLANTEYSRTKKSGMFEKYKEEYPDFKKELYRVEFKQMFSYMDKMYGLDKSQ